MAASSDFVSGSDLDEIFELIDGGFLEDDDHFNQEVERFIAELPSDDQLSTGFACDKCGKVCKSKQGLSRHKYMSMLNTQPHPLLVKVLPRQKKICC